MTIDTQIEVLKKIISSKAAGKTNEEVADDALVRFYKEIEDESFFMPPLFILGNKYRHMIFNYSDLKIETRLIFEKAVITKWDKFHGINMDAQVESMGEPAYSEDNEISAKKKKLPKVAVKKQSASPKTVSKARLNKPSGEKKKKRSKIDMLKNDLQDLAVSMKTLEQRIELLLNRFPG